MTGGVLARPTGQAKRVGLHRARGLAGQRLGCLRGDAYDHPVNSTTGGIRLGQVGGVPIRIAASWFVIAAIITLLYANVVSQYTGPGPAAYAGAFGFAVLLAGSVLAHEAAHAIAARRFGLVVDEIVVDLWGGHTSLGVPRTPWQAGIVAVVAPLTNIALAAVVYGVTVAVAPTGLVGFLLDALVLSNVLVGVFNLLPGLPLDGGRVAEAIVWAITRDQDRGTEVAGWGGRVVVVGAAVVVLGLPLSRGGTPSLVSVIWIALLGATLWRAASAAIRIARTRRLIRAVDLGPARVPAAALPSGSTVQDWRHHHSDVTTILLDEAGAPVAVIDAAAAAAVPDAATATTPLSAVAIRLGVGASAPLTSGPLDLVQLLSSVGGPGIVLLGSDPPDRPVAWVSSAALSHALATADGMARARR